MSKVDSLKFTLQVIKCQWFDSALGEFKVSRVASHGVCTTVPDWHPEDKEPAYLYHKPLVAFLACASRLLRDQLNVTEGVGVVTPEEGISQVTEGGKYEEDDVQLVNESDSPGLVFASTEV